MPTAQRVLIAVIAPAAVLGMVGSATAASAVSAADDREHRADLIVTGYQRLHDLPRLA
ncbi:hypothetical protein [Saccharothrix deserti]|uniref:hypothetical protein n=1 Tax=Saccharothrix deserti TaxID=2593674 RepID=UPI00131E5AE3|nr:hypothetical protein [Saccharothrix deserti]